METKIISADGHMDLFYLPADTFTSRAPAHLKDRVPKVIPIDGKPTWVGDKLTFSNAVRLYNLDWLL